MTLLASLQVCRLYSLGALLQGTDALDASEHCLHSLTPFLSDKRPY